MTEVEKIIGDWSFMTKIGAKPSTKTFEPVSIASKITGKLRQGETITLADIPEEWTRLPVFLDDQSLPFVLYISDQYWSYRITKGYKFHFKWCAALQEMKERGKIDRYRAKYDICNPAFEINDNDREELKVCMRCCSEFPEVYRFFDANRWNIVNKFRMPEFFEKFGIINLPASTHPGGRDDYTRNWPKVALREKEKAGWRCQDPNHVGNRDFSQKSMIYMCTTNPASRAITYRPT